MFGRWAYCVFPLLLLSAPVGCQQVVNEAWFRLVDQRGVAWQNRAHFFGIAAQTMRRVLLDYARLRQAAKRGGAPLRVTLDENMPESGKRIEDLLAVDQALSRLEALDRRQCRIVELRFFAGLTVEETGEILNVSPITIKREWASAKAWLYREMSKSVSS